MREVVLDASVVIKWFRSHDERHVEEALALRAAYERGELLVLAPPLLGLEVVNVAGRRWGLKAKALDQLAAALGDVGFEWVDPDLLLVAEWTARGLTAYDSAYVAVAAQRDTTVISDDEGLVSIAGQLAESLG
jgi:predicted nucleic acid-binding protein